jgi:tetratricopeptide (TPR) repeat protein
MGGGDVAQDVNQPAADGQIQSADSRVETADNQVQTAESQIEALLARHDYTELVRACASDPARLIAIIESGWAQGNWAVAVPVALTAQELGTVDANLLFTIGHALRWRWALTKAQDAYRAAIIAAPGNVAACSGLVEVLQTRGRTDEAQEVLNEALVTNPDDETLLVLSVQLKRARYDVAGALAELERLLARNPLGQGAVVAQLETLLRIRALDRAATAASDARTTWLAQDSEVLWYSGAIAAAREEYSTARALFEESIDHWHASPAMTQYRRGFGLALAKDAAGALAAYRGSCEQDPDEIGSWGNQVSILWSQGRYRAARDAYTHLRHALDRRRQEVGEISHPEIYSFLGGVLVEVERDFAGAELELERARQVGNDQPSLLIQQIECYRERRTCGSPPPRSERRRVTQPRLWLQGESQSDPELDAHDASEDYWRARERYTRCKRMLLEWLARHETVGLRQMLGRLCLAMGELDDARIHFERVCDLYPESPYPWAQLGVIATHAGQHRSARRCFERALEREPDDLTARTNLAEACRKSGQVDRAEVEYQRVLAVANGNVEARVGLAELYLARGEESGDPDVYHEAITYLTHALEYGSSDMGSKWLKHGEESVPSAKELSAILYSRGYASVKLYEASGPLADPSLLSSALRDFRECHARDRTQHKAERAISRLEERTGRFKPDWLEDTLGPRLIVGLAVVVFVLTQLSFYSDWLVANFQPAYYVTLTLGSLLFAIAGLGLPRLLRLKVAGIELERSTVTQVSSTIPLGIGK